MAVDSRATSGQYIGKVFGIHISVFHMDIYLCICTWVFVYLCIYSFVCVFVYILFTVCVVLTIITDMI